MTQPSLKQLGELLRQQREEKNLSLKEVENAISVRINHLKAIEEGGSGKLISPVYAKGFVKQYAGFLGLDGEQLVTQYRDAFGVAERQEFTYGIGTLEQRSHPGVKVRWLPNILYAVVTVALLVMAWFFAHYMGVL